MNGSHDIPCGFWPVLFHIFLINRCSTHCFPTVAVFGPPFRSSETLKGRETHIRESWIRCMEARIVRENLQKCYYFEGVNHYANCKDLADKYSKMIRDNKVSNCNAKQLTSGLWIQGHRRVEAVTMH